MPPVLANRELLEWALENLMKNALDALESDGEIRVQAPPVTLSRTPASVRLHSPDPGEHTAEILGELGLSADEIRSLRVQLRQSFSAGLRGNDAVSLNNQQIGKKLNVLGRVVDDKYFHGVLMRALLSVTQRPQFCARRAAL